MKTLISADGKIMFRCDMQYKEVSKYPYKTLFFVAVKCYFLLHLFSTSIF